MKTRTYRLLTGLLMFLGSLFIYSCAKPPKALEATLIPNPNETAPLAGILKVKADKPVTISFVISDGKTDKTVTMDEESGTDLTIPVLELHPDTDYTITATLHDNEGLTTILDPLSLRTPSLPDDFPKIDLTLARQGEMESGVTLFNIFRWKSPFEDDRNWGYLIAVDENGEVVWYLKPVNGGAGEGRRMRNGNLFFGGHEDGRLYEVDMLGTIINEWHSAGAVTAEVPEESKPVNTDTFHHDVIQTSEGNFIALGLEVRHDEDFPLEYAPGTRRGPANLACDVIVEFAPDGTTLREHHLADILDPERLGPGSLQQGFYESIYKDRFDSLEMPFDITHGNAIYYVEEEDALIISMNYQCALIKMDMESGEIKWILGDPIGWNEELSKKLLIPVGEVTWPCHQHGVEMTSNGTLLMFDNGGSRNIPPQPPMAPEEQFSRAVEYRINEAEGTVEEVWSYGPAQERFVSPFISDADQLPETGNILITDGGRFMDAEGKPMPTFGGHQWGRILEVTNDPQPVKLWEVTVKDPEVRYSIYRAQRLKSLYPGKDRPTG